MLGVQVIGHDQDVVGNREDRSSAAAPTGEAGRVGFEIGMSETLLDQAITEIKRLMRQKGKPTHDVIREGLGKFFYKQTNRRPVVLPSIVKIPTPEA